MAQKRESLNKTLEEVEKETKIRAKYLAALEKGEYGKLPTDTHCIGFLKNYSEYLELDQEEIIELYKKERDVKVNIKQAISPQKKEKFKYPRMILTPKILVIYSIILASLGVALYIGWQVKILTAAPKLEVSSPAGNMTAEGDSIEIIGKTDPGADIYINGSPINISPDGSFKEKITLQNGLNVIQVKAKNKVGKETEVERNVAATLKPITLVDAVNQNVVLKIDAGPNSAWVYVEIDGVPVEKDGILMLSGASRIFTAKEKLVLTTKNAGSTNITLNGKDIGVLGKEGEEVKNREFTKDMQIR